MSWASIDVRRTRTYDRARPDGTGSQDMDAFFEITTGAIDEQTNVVEPHGDIDAATAGQLQLALEAAIATGSRYVILDLDYTTFLDPRGVLAMIAADRALDEAGG